MIMAQLDSGNGFAGVSFLITDNPDEPTPTSKVRRDTKSVGDRSEAEVIPALIRNGFSVSIPFGENHPYDLLADDGSKIHRIQVKTGRLLASGSIVFNCYSSHLHRGGPCRSYLGEVEYIAVYCPQLHKVYLIPESDITRTQAYLRVLPARNCQNRKLRWAVDYELL